jgi:hypothetical protein
MNQDGQAETSDPSQLSGHWKNIARDEPDH